VRRRGKRRCGGGVKSKGGRTGRWRMREEAEKSREGKKEG